jgi:cullin-associated NEDD8-dissociated protein 1
MFFYFFFSDLSKNSGLKKSILDCFNHNSEEVKSAASYALGNISLGNLKEYLPFVLNEIETQPKRQYLLLHSLKEVRNKFLRPYQT